jgi:hypothetical protein
MIVPVALYAFGIWSLWRRNKQEAFHSSFIWLRSITATGLNLTKAYITDQ